MIDSTHLHRDLDAIRQQAPLIDNITNYVAMNFSANALLALGASPVMAHAIEEVEEMALHAGALVLNIGTIDTPWLDAMLRAGTSMRQRQGITILDPVGVGATRFRHRAAWEIIDRCHPHIIRGNASEILALADNSDSGRGVDSTASPDIAVESARQLARHTHAVVCVSGPTDYITDGIHTDTIDNGSPLQTRVTAMGCTATAVVGAFAAVNPDPYEATLHGMALMGVAGEMAAERSQGPGTMATAFLDILYNITSQQVCQRLANNEFLQQ